MASEERPAKVQKRSLIASTIGSGTRRSQRLQHDKIGIEDTDLLCQKENQENIDVQSRRSDNGKGKAPRGSTSNDEIFRLIDLPTEIRLEIYRACLTRPYDILLSKTAPSRPDSLESFAKQVIPDTKWLSPNPSEAGFQIRTAMLDDNQARVEKGQNPCSYTSAQFHQVFLDTGRLRRPRSVTTTGRPIRSTGATSARARLRPQVEGSNRSSASSAAPMAAMLSNVVSPQTSVYNAHFQSTIPSYASPSSNIDPARSGPTTRPRKTPKSKSTDPLIVNILRVSKDIYKEARDVFYSENTFKLDINTAISSLAALHQRSRRHIKRIELEIPNYTEILERFSEIVRLSLRYCTGLQTFVIHLPFNLPGSDPGALASMSSGNSTVYANGFDILRWLPQTCQVVLKGQRIPEVEVVVNKHVYLARTQDKVCYISRSYSYAGEIYSLCYVAIVRRVGQNRGEAMR